MCCKFKHHSRHITFKLSWNWFGSIAAEEAVKHSNNSKCNPKSRSFKHFAKFYAKGLYLTLNQIPGFWMKVLCSNQMFSVDGPADGWAVCNKLKQQHTILCIRIHIVIYRGMAKMADYLQMAFFKCICLKETFLLLVQLLPQSVHRILIAFISISNNNSFMQSGSKPSKFDQWRHQDAMS